MTPSDDPFCRPDVQALCEAVAAGDDPTAAYVLADHLEDLGVRSVAVLLELRRGPCRVWRWGDYHRHWWVRLGRHEFGAKIVWYGVAFPTSGTNSPLWPVAAALALAADRLASRTKEPTP